MNGLFLDGGHTPSLSDRPTLIDLDQTNYDARSQAYLLLCTQSTVV